MKIVDVKYTYGGPCAYIRGIYEDGSETNPIDRVYAETKTDSIKRLEKANNRDDVNLRLQRRVSR